MNFYLNTFLKKIKFIVIFFIFNQSTLLLGDEFGPTDRTPKEPAGYGGVPLLPRSWPQKRPIRVELFKSGSNIICRLRIRKGFGIQAGKDYSYVTFYKITKKGRKKRIRLVPFKGIIDKSNNSYFKTVYPVKIRKNRFKNSSEVVAKVELLYCNLKKGICYQFADEKRVKY